MRARWQALCQEMGDAHTAALYVAHRLLGRLTEGRVRIVPYALYAQAVGHPALQAVKADPNEPLYQRILGAAELASARTAQGEERLAKLNKPLAISTVLPLWLLAHIVDGAFLPAAVLEPDWNAVRQSFPATV